jgi:signal transduction histidine kinase
MKKNAADETLRRAGKMLHDEVGPLLASAGLRLQLLRMDHPQAAEQINELLVTLDDAMERVRALSHELSPSPLSATPARRRQHPSTPR